MQIASLLAIYSAHPLATALGRRKGTDEGSHGNKTDYHGPTERGLHTVVYSGGPSFPRQDGVCFDTPYSVTTNVGSGVNFDRPEV
jgi:hypothetical protein